MNEKGHPKRNISESNMDSYETPRPMRLWNIYLTTPEQQMITTKARNSRRISEYMFQLKGHSRVWTKPFSCLPSENPDNSQIIHKIINIR